ncbi:MAG: hypothetical protein ACI4D9_01695 [Lachnospiraceae bacterium]
MSEIKERFEKMKCKDCDHKKFMEGNGNPGRHYCHHPDARFARSECEPVPMICRTGRHDKEVTIKTSPKWCPLRRNS